MKKDTLLNCKRISLFAFIAVEFALWMLILFADFGGMLMRCISYGSVVLCFAYSLFYLEGKKDSLLQSGALLFTAVADFFLILLGGQHKTLAMCAFLCAQIFYAARIYLLASSEAEKKLQLILRLCTSTLGALLVLLVLREGAEALFVISVVYYVNLILSMCFAFAHCKEGLGVLLLAIGLLCFALCDISIGFDFLVDIFSLEEGNFIYTVVSLPISFVNVFYPPSQTLLCISAKKLEI